MHRATMYAVAWGIDPDQTRRAAFSARFPDAEAFGDGLDPSATSSAEIVPVCGPTFAHAAGVDIALGAGARVIVCEKPIAPTWILTSRGRRTRPERRLFGGMKVGIVGLGRIGHAFGVSALGDPLCHSEAYARVEGAALAWGLDPDPARRASFEARFAGVLAFPDAAAVPADVVADVVCVCSPTADHAAGVQLALRVGARAVVCEKPLAPTAAEAQAIVDSCRVAGRILVVNYSRRFSPMLGHLQRAASPGGMLSGPVSGSIRFDGGLIHNGTHWIDLCRAVFGDVVGVRTLPTDRSSARDLGRSVELVFSRDRRVLLCGTDAMDYSVGEGEFMGRSGAIRFEESGARVSAYSPVVSPTWAGYRRLGACQLLTTEGLRGNLTTLARHALDLARDGGTPACTGEDGVAALLAAEQALTAGAAQATSR